MIRQREMEEQMRRQREENYSRMGYMDPVSEITIFVDTLPWSGIFFDIFSRLMCFASFRLDNAMSLCRWNSSSWRYVCLIS